MFDSRVVKIKILNNSQIALNFQWTLSGFQSLNGDYLGHHTGPFAFEPRTRAIASGKAEGFEVLFSSCQVDEFSALIHCENPFLTAIDQPMVPVTWMSLRPSSHFNVESTHYISAGRRL
jgi:hypothetical protein